MHYWRTFYGLHPFDDLHRIHRPAALLFSVHAGKGASESFTSALDMLAPKQKKPMRLPRRARTVKGTP